RRHGWSRIAARLQKMPVRPPCPAWRRRFAGQPQTLFRLQTSFDPSTHNPVVTGSNGLDSDSDDDAHLRFFFSSFNSIHAGAWSLVFSQPRTSLSTPAAMRRLAMAGL